MKKIFLQVLFLLSLSIYAQTKGKIVDENNNPIPFANIWVENEAIGTTAEENGDFSITLKDNNKILVFSAIGYETAKCKASQVNVITLKSTAYQINEVVIAKRFETKEKEIGSTNSAISQAFDNGPRIDVKYFPYYQDYKKTKYIKQVVINTDSKIESAICKIHFYSVAENGFPGAPLLDKDFIVTIKQGLKKTRIDITQFNLRMPKNGLFIGFEKLIIERNKLEKTTTDYNNNTTRVQKIYFPLVLYNFIERNALFTFSGGKWNKETAAVNKKIMVYEPAINLILTN